MAQIWRNICGVESMVSDSFQDEFQKLLSILEVAKKSLKISEIEQLLDKDISRRTLQRRLDSLLEMGKITAKGQRSGRKYHIATQTTAIIQLSQESLALQQAVLRPLPERAHVHYNRDFLYSYQPNNTYYLTKEIRRQLHQAGQQFNHQLAPGTYVKRILHRLLIDLSWNSSRLEGNTYSLLETERLLDYGAEAEGKHAFEAQMILNHKDAIEFMIAQIDTPEINRYVVLNIHALLSNNLLANPKARGQLRKIPVGVENTNYHPPEIPELLNEYFQKILDTANQITDPFEQSFFLMVHIPYLQAFEDVNKRVSRLISNIPLIKNNLSPLSFIDVPKKEYVAGLLAIYELNRIELLRDIYVWAYRCSAQHYQVEQYNLTDPNLFYMKYKDRLGELIRDIVANNIRGKAIISTIEQWSDKHINKNDRQQFIHLTEKEISSLHEGNIAVYGIGFETFAHWKIK